MHDGCVAKADPTKVMQLAVICFCLNESESVPNWHKSTGSRKGWSTERIGTQAETARIHDVFLVCYVEPYKGDGPKSRPVPDMITMSLRGSGDTRPTLHQERPSAQVQILIALYWLWC